MKKALVHLIAGWGVVSILVSSSFPAFAAETDEMIPAIEIFTPGMTRTITITQNRAFPLEYHQILILLAGYGGVSISVSKNDTEGDPLILAGLAVSSAGVVPFLKYGVTHVTLREGIEIGNERAPYGLLWIASWVNLSVYDPPYNTYTLTLAF